MTLFEQVKECVTARQAAEHYGIKVKGNGMACCPFHKDRHPSMKADKIYHCFACGVGGDAIDFTARLFGISQYEAAKKLIEDFGLDIKVEDRNKYKRTHQSRNTLISKKPKVVMIREKLEQWLKLATDVLIRYLKWIQFWKEFYKPEPDESGAGKSEPEFLFGNAGNQLLPDLFNQFSAVADESSAGKTRKTEKTIRWIW